MYQNSSLILMLSGTIRGWNYGQVFGERAIRRLSTTAFVAMLALTMPGCGSGSEEGIAPTPPAPQPATQPFDKPPMVTQQAEKSTILSASSFIQPTNGNQRAKQVQKGRQDPFAGLLVQTVQSVPTTATPQRVVPRLPNLPAARPSQQRVAVQRRSSSRIVVVPQPRAIPLPNPRAIASGSRNRQSIPPLPPLVPGSTSGPALPPPPQEPNLANGVAVRGVIQVGNEMQAIVQVPNEATSRYVRLGQRLSNGQVLVKRIEMNEGSDPIVILEQYGVEVAKTVGEEPSNTAQTPTPTPAAPSPTPSQTPDSEPPRED